MTNPDEHENTAGKPGIVRRVLSPGPSAEQRLEELLAQRRRELEEHAARLRESIAELERREELLRDSRASVERIRETPFIPRAEKVRGYVYEVETGELREVSAS